MKKVIILMLGLIFLAGCGPTTATSPDGVVNQFWELYKDGNTEEAMKFVVEGRAGEIRVLDLDMDKDIDEMEESELEILKRLELAARGYEEDGDIAIVNVSVTKPNLKETFESFFAVAVDDLMAMAYSGAGQQEIDERSDELMLQALKDASDITHEEKAELHLVNGEWKIYDWKFDNIDERVKEIEKIGQ